jgi:hypothetical protein
VDRPEAPSVAGFLVVGMERLRGSDAMDRPGLGVRVICSSS